MRYGVTVPFHEGALAEQRERHLRLVDLGYTDVWSSEADGVDAVTPLAMASAWAPSLRTGTAVLPAFTRGPAVLAQTAAALASASPGGFVCGVGASSPAVVEQWNGIPHHDPIGRTRDVVRFLRAALAGERVDMETASFTVRRFRLSAPPASPPPIVVAALRPGMVRLAATEADGVVLNWLSASDVGAVVDEMGGPGPEVVTRIMVVPTVIDAAVRGELRRLVCTYLNVPAYAAAQAWLGRGERLAPMWEAWARGDRARALELVPDEVVDELVVHGDPAECRERVQAYVAAGVTTPVIALLPFGPPVDAALEALAPR